jgi:hypothetical protein
MQRALSENGCAIFPWNSGPFSFATIIPASSIGPPSKRIRRGWMATPSLNHTRRRLHVHYRGRNSAPGYHCCGKDLVNGRGVYCLNVGGTVIEQAVADAFLQAITPAAIEATRLSVEQLQANHDAALSQWRLEVERAHYEAERAERRYRAVEPENRLVARGLESEWENRLRDLAAAEMELQRREQQRPITITPAQLQTLQRLGADIRQVWTAPTTTDRDRKAAQILGMNTSSIHRWLADGFITGEQLTPGAPLQIRITEELRSRIVPQAPPKYVPMIVATAKLGVSRQTVLQRVKRGELKAMLVRQGRHKGLRIKVIDQQPQLFQ